ncbi:MAG: methyltransferase family protein [Rhodospirillaceae bacterium]
MRQEYFGLLIGAIWVVWVIYWRFGPGSGKAVARKESGGSQLSYGLLLFAGLILVVHPQIARDLGVGALADLIWPQSILANIIAVVFVVVGLGFSVWARVHLADNWSAAVTVKEGHELIRSGPYKYVRHPIYTGILIAILGSVVLADRWVAFLGLALMTASFVVKLRIEERFMADQFGDAYQLYKKEVAALVPGLF